VKYKSSAKSKRDNSKTLCDSAKPQRVTAKTFRASLERMRSNLGWVIARIPFNVEKTWGKRGMLRVKGEINGFAFSKSLFRAAAGAFPAGQQCHAKARACARECPRVSPRAGLAARRRVPPELKRFLVEDAMLGRWFEKLNFSTRYEIGRFITEPKGAGTRQRRAEQMAERLLAVMEAELELPPALQLAFAGNPRAREGWRLMSPSYRRGHLFGIFYYRTLGARARRIEKTLQEAAGLAEKKLGSAP
jgi:hypothetical protein